MLQPYLKLVVAPMFQPGGIVIRLLESKKFHGTGFMSFQKANAPISFFDGESLQNEHISEEWFREIPFIELEKIFSKLKGVVVPIIPEEIYLPHGVEYCLTIRNGTDETRYRWRMKAPAGWEAIEEVANDLLRLANEQEATKQLSAIG
jgi:hypothetical protein